MKKYTIQVIAKSYDDMDLGERKMKGDLLEVTKERAEKLVSLGLVQIMGIEDVEEKVKTKATKEKEVREKSPKVQKEKKTAKKKATKKKTAKKVVKKTAKKA